MTYVEMVCAIYRNIRCRLQIGGVLWPEKTKNELARFMLPVLRYPHGATRQLRQDRRQYRARPKTALVRRSFVVGDHTQGLVQEVRGNVL